MKTQEQIDKKFDQLYDEAERLQSEVIEINALTWQEGNVDELLNILGKKAERITQITAMLKILNWVSLITDIEL